MNAILVICNDHFGPAIIGSTRGAGTEDTPTGQQHKSTGGGEDPREGRLSWVNTPTGTEPGRICNQLASYVSPQYRMIKTKKKVGIRSNTSLSLLSL